MTILILFDIKEVFLVRRKEPATEQAQIVVRYSFAKVLFYEFLKGQLHNCIDYKKNAKLCFSCDMKGLVVAPSD